jgi:hypothetical protein
VGGGGRGALAWRLPAEGCAPVGSYSGRSALTGGGGGGWKQQQQQQRSPVRAAAAAPRLVERLLLAAAAFGEGEEKA